MLSPADVHGILLAKRAAAGSPWAATRLGLPSLRGHEGPEAQVATQ